MSGKILPESLIANLPFLEELYQQYQLQERSGELSQAPSSKLSQVDHSWELFFQALESEKLNSDQSIALPRPLSTNNERILRLIEAYRWYGHLFAAVNPIALIPVQMPEQLKLESLGFQSSENEELFPTGHLLPQPHASLSSIVDLLQRKYASTVGFEFKGFVDPLIEQWIQGEIESGRFDTPFELEDQQIILDMLMRAELLETFLHTKHVGKKRFSLEGAETLIPLLTFMIDKAIDRGVEEIFIGMSHRGRLNVLANILKKPIEAILQDFDEEYDPSPGEGMGDIRYHKGHANDSVISYKGKSLRLSVAPNPSHLESIDPVVEGKTHAKQFLVNDEKERNRIIPLLMHGDAALAGQGVVYEILQMNKLSGFETGGTLHIVINNQIGFTTSPNEARSTRYCTDIAKTFGSPVFHVNAEDPEMCVRVALFAFEIRSRFHCDVFIDLNCYRKYGHNEGDEPFFTQPVEYQLIRNRKSIRETYTDMVLQEGGIEKSLIEKLEVNYKKELLEAYQNFQEKKEQKSSLFSLDDEESLVTSRIDTRVDGEVLRKIAVSLSAVPEGFHLNQKLEHLFKERTRAIIENKSIDWGTAELLAYGSLLCEGISVRLAGQDSGRGTFSHRHALWVDQMNNHPYYPLEHIQPHQGRFEVINTSLSEVAALGFEYGYSTICTKGLTIWEAQFGDFVNSAQVIIDQYLAGGEQKWGQCSNLVLFLPHGFEGQGPEHSSARFERFLALAGHDNMQIVNPTTPAQHFHLLRRQVKQKLLKPLVVMTPKGLLRHQQCVSTVEDLTRGEFRPILDDPENPKQPRRLILCSGRIYYDLDAERKREKRTDLAIIRFEQLYPLDIKECKRIFEQYQNCRDCIWVQEEPENMGAWPFMSSILPEFLPRGMTIAYVGRERSATPATGFFARHKQEQIAILHKVFSL